MELEAIRDRLRGLAEPIVAAAGLELVQLELQGRVVRLYIDKPDGVTHDDCERVSRQFSSALDDGEAGPAGSYTLEVSSPGLDRPLVKPGDFERFAGRKAVVKTRAPIEGRSRFTGRLAGWREGRIALELAGGAVVELELAGVASARLEPEWPQPPAKAGRGGNRKH